MRTIDELNAFMQHERPMFLNRLACIPSKERAEMVDFIAKVEKMDDAEIVATTRAIFGAVKEMLVNASALDGQDV